VSLPLLPGTRAAPHEQCVWSFRVGGLAGDGSANNRVNEWCYTSKATRQIAPSNEKATGLADTTRFGGRTLTASARTSWDMDLK
jgi:hypothetical protein